MSYENRRPVFNLSGSLAAGCGALDTQISSTAFVSLPTNYSSSSYLPLVLANDTQGKAEIVWVIGHSSASQTVTVVRGMEGTTAQAFDTGDVVRCAPTTRDVLSLWTRSTLPADAHYGMRATLSDENITVERTSTGWNDSSPFKADSTRKHLWQQTGAILTAGADQLLVGLPAGAGGGGIASQSAGKVTLGRAGLWTLCYATNSDNTVDGYMNAGMTWSGGAFLINPYFTVPRHVSSAGSGFIRTWLTWTGYVTAAQASQPISIIAGQQNTNGGQLNNCAYYVSAEYLGA